MIYQVEIELDPSELNEDQLIMDRICRKAGLRPEEIRSKYLKLRSIDSRKKPLYKLRYNLYVGDDDFSPGTTEKSLYRDVTNCEEVVIVGAGPAGYFAALQCLKLGFRPIVLDRGKDARSRRRDLRAIQQEGVVNPDSNYCFGEGGAGTYSDGKLYTRSKKRGSIEVVLKTLVEHGADPEILVEAHPHIGSNKLPTIISNIRDTIIEHGGQVLFNHKVIDFDIVNRSIKGVYTNHGRTAADKVILATGHSARDIYQLLVDKGIQIEAKPFAIGVRVEHSQGFIDAQQYGQSPRHPNLPPASYRLACDVNGRGVFSFCMCPGGLIVPTATAPGEIVVNGMSLSRRNSPFSNAGIVVAISVADAQNSGYKGALACMQYQSVIEQRMFEAGDGSQKAPAQRLSDFIKGKASADLGATSYIPGLISQRLDQLLPIEISENLKKGFTIFDRKMKGFAGREAMVIGVESRTSAPVRIPRNVEHCMHPQITGLYPCGEGAGYAGGIVSAAIDGQRVVEAIAHSKMEKI
jgi:uncharacterized FAD-dependent dehydrogenase